MWVTYMYVHSLVFYVHIEYFEQHIPEGYNVSYPNYGVNMNINVNDGNLTERVAIDVQ